MNEGTGEKCRCKSPVFWGIVAPLILLSGSILLFFLALNNEAKGGRPEFGSITLFIGIFLAPFILAGVLALMLYGYMIATEPEPDCPLHSTDLKITKDS